MQTERATLGGGCFWCLEAAYQLIDGVVSVQSGYAGGETKNPTYREVSSGRSGHAEVTQVEFDPGKLAYEDILEIFWAIHDPTTSNRQGNDVGPQYRSIILYHDDAQRKQAERSKVAHQKLWDDPIVTEIEPLERFYPAEPEHADYYRRNRADMYCQVVINPKLRKLRERFADRLTD